MMMNKDIIHIPEFLNHDQFIELLENIDNFTSNDDFPGWKLTGGSSFDTYDKTFWYLNLENDKKFTEYFFNIVQSKIKEITGEEVEIYRVYLNGATYGQQGYYHLDSNRDTDRTLLIYCNPEWTEEWTGATVFNENGKITTIYPKPLSAVYFKATIPHFSQPVSKDFLGLRVTLAYKLSLTNGTNSQTH